MHLERTLAVLIALATALAAPSAAGEDIRLPRSQPVPGGIALVPLHVDGDPRPVARYRDRPVMTLRDGSRWLAVVGIPLSAGPGRHHVSVERADGETIKRTFEVKKKRYEEQHITIENKRKVNPYKDDLRRIRRERKEINAALSRFSDATPAPLSLMLPVDGTLTSPFGLRRFFNEQPRKPHSGIDIAAERGTPIRAPAAGWVIETGDYFFNGNTVFIDHGQGLVTMYCHMDRIDVEPGERLERGEQFGTIGSTGRVTGPHLHWGVALNRAMVNPHLLMPGETGTASRSE